MNLIKMVHCFFNYRSK